MTAIVLSLVLTLGLENSSYTVTEGDGVLEVCVILVNSTYSEPVEFLLTTENGRATGKVHFTV